MRGVSPFRAHRYDPRVAPLARVVTQPYDKITPAMQDRYYAADPHNLVRIILGKADPADDQNNNVYTRAAEYFRRWRQERVLVQDTRPSLYLYTQRFRVPGTTIELERAGFIALGRICDYSEGVVFRHEQTLSQPKTDRLNLLRATRAHFGQIFMLYSDPGREVEILLRSTSLTASPGATRQSSADAAMAEEPDISVTDEYGVLHRLWCVSDPQMIESVARLMADKRLIIADGHHRYETALAYRDQRRAEAGGLVVPDAPYERVMMTFVNMDAPGLVILPTHRVVFGLENFDRERFVGSLGTYFEIEPLAAEQPVEAAIEQLRQAGKAAAAFVCLTRDSRFLLRARPGAAEPLLRGVPGLQRDLDVVYLHKIILEAALGISEQAVRNQENVAYYRSAEDAVQRVRADGNAAFLMNPVSVQQVRDIAFAGGVLPQKSTDFYPKLLSGLTVYALE